MEFRSSLELAHAIGQQPQGTVQADVGVNALHRTRLLAAPVGAAPGKPALGQVLLGDGLRPRATVVDKVMELVKTAGQATAGFFVPTARQAERAGSALPARRSEIFARHIALSARSLHY